MTAFILNGKSVSVDVLPDTPLLWVLRDHLKLTGTKFGCGAGLCGACTVLLDGQALRSCTLPVNGVEGRHITTIEGLGDRHPVQQAWVEGSVPQCGYCQSGQILATVALLNSNPDPDDNEIKAALAGNLCRCGAYQQIIEAVYAAAEKLKATGMGNDQGGAA